MILARGLGVEREEKSPCRYRETVQPPRSGEEARSIPARRDQMIGNDREKGRVE